MSTANDILNLMLNDISDSYQKTIGFPTYDILAAVSLRMVNTDAEVAEAREKLDPENLSGDELDRYIFPRVGLVRREATFATGVLDITGNGNISAGDLFESGGGIQFEATESVTISGTGQVHVTCLREGDAGNLPAHSITQMPVTISGITSCDNPEPTTGGYDEEADTAYFERFLIKVRTPPTSGNIYHYQSWALEVPGVGHVKVFPLGHGDSTVDVVIVDSEGKPADDDLVNNVQEYIDPNSTGEGLGEAPIGAKCYVSSAAAKTISINVQISKLDSASQENVTQTVKDAVSAYLGSVAFLQDFVSYAQIGVAILNADGVQDFENLTVNGGTANIAVGERECAVLGDAVIYYA